MATHCPAIYRVNPSMGELITKCKGKCISVFVSSPSVTPLCPPTHTWNKLTLSPRAQPKEAASYDIQLQVPDFCLISTLLYQSWRNLDLGTC